MLFGNRRRLEALAVREASGESLWTAAFDATARTKIVLACQDATADQYRAETVYDVARGLILRDEGLFFLVEDHLSTDRDLLTYVLNVDNASVPNAIEAMSFVLNNRPLMASLSWVHWPGPGFDERVNTVLREHRIAYELINSEMVEIQSLAMHRDVVAPVARLLGSTEGLQAVEKAYRDAIEELADDKPVMP